MPVFSKSWKFWLNRWFYVIFHEMSHFSHLLAEKLTKTLKHGSFIGKLQIDDFSCFLTKWATFSNFLLKSSPKRRDVAVSSKSCKFRPIKWFRVIFYEISHFLHLFAEKLTKTLKHDSFIEKLQALVISMIFRAFWRNEPLFATFCWKVHQNAETS